MARVHLDGCVADLHYGGNGIAGKRENSPPAWQRRRTTERTCPGVCVTICWRGQFGHREPPVAVRSVPARAYRPRNKDNALRRHYKQDHPLQAGHDKRAKIASDDVTTNDHPHARRSSRMHAPARQGRPQKIRPDRRRSGNGWLPRGLSGVQSMPWIVWGGVWMTGRWGQDRSRTGKRQ